MSVTQVNVRHRPCFGRNSVSCNCAVVFRENNNILGLFACQHGQPAVPVRYLVDPLAPADNIDVRRGGSQYTVIYTHVKSICNLKRKIIVQFKREC